ncbi:MAG TPA: o-succinylbenzoate--CoA ligase, partial [Thermaerobacter sp.]
TGDLGYLDEEGYLYVVDRRDDLIISGGENVYPAEVEAVLLSHPAVEEAGVAGLDDPQWGQVPAAVVRLRPGWGSRGGDEGGEEGEEGVEAGERAPALTEDLIRFCEQRLARYKVPRRIVIVDEPLPRTANGKLQRRLLRGLLEGRR